MILFALLLALIIVVTAVVLAAGVTSDAILVPLVFQGGLGAALLVVLLVGLQRRDPWGLTAVAPICTILVVAGALQVALALGNNEIKIPLEGLGAALVLSRRPPFGSVPSVDAGGVALRLVIVVLFGASTFWPMVVPPA